MEQLKTLTKADNVSILFGEWFDKTAGNTYYDAEIYIGEKRFDLPYKYGYNHGDQQAIDEALEECGYRVRINKGNRFAPYRHLHTRCIDKLKRELIKHYSES